MLKVIELDKQILLQLDIKTLTNICLFNTILNINVKND